MKHLVLRESLSKKTAVLLIDDKQSEMYAELKMFLERIGYSIYDSIISANIYLVTSENLSKLGNVSDKYNIIEVPNSFNFSSINDIKKKIHVRDQKLNSKIGLY